jgi:hypothetical protein
MYVRCIVCICLRALHVWCCASVCVGAWCGSCVAVTSVQWVCEPWWVVSAVVAVVSVRGRKSSMRGSAVSTPAVVVSGDACACVQVPGAVQQPDQRQLSVGGVRAVVPSVRAVCAVCCVFARAWAVGGVRCAVYSAQLLLCVRVLHVWCCVSACIGAWCGM